MFCDWPTRLFCRKVVYYSAYLLTRYELGSKTYTRIDLRDEYDKMDIGFVVVAALADELHLVVVRAK